jgi:hypothetical protein
LIVGLDATFLLYFFAPLGSVGVPLDSEKQPIPFAKERVSGLIAELEKAGSTIIVPTPALAEIMVRSGVQAGQAYTSIMHKSKVFEIVPFDQKSAVEVALMAGHALRGEDGKSPADGTYAKLKYDRQIVAIAHTERAATFYTDDGRQGTLAKRLGMTVRGLADCIVPAGAAQVPMPLQGGHGDKLTEG